MSQIRQAGRNRPTPTARPKRPALLLLTVATLPLTYVPLEIDPSGTSFAGVSLTLVLLSAFRYGGFRGRMHGVEWLGLIFAGWIALRLSLFASLEGLPIRTELVFQEGVLLVGGVLLYRLARREDLRAHVITGLGIAVVIMISFEAYQLLVGHARLQAIGYLTPRFNYYTESGAMRPFATFLSPTVFAGYLAMVGVALVFASRRRRPVLWMTVVGVALALTYTRAAWIAFALALFICALFVSARARSRLLIWSLPALWVFIVSLLLVPQIWTTLVDRLGTIGQAGYESNDVRIQLWDAALIAVSQNPLLGLGGTPFVHSLPAHLVFFTHAHSNYMQVLYQYGIIGVGLFASLLLAFVSAAIRSDSPKPYKLAAIAAVVAFATDSAFEGTWGSAAVSITLFLLAGLGAPTQKAPTHSPWGLQAGASSVGTGANRFENPTDLAVTRPVFGEARKTRATGGPSRLWLMNP